MLLCRLFHHRTPELVLNEPVPYQICTYERPRVAPDSRQQQGQADACCGGAPDDADQPEERKELASDDAGYDAQQQPAAQPRVVALNAAQDNPEEQQYLELIREIMEKGVRKGDRTGVGRFLILCWGDPFCCCGYPLAYCVRACVVWTHA